jgi:hypothetical protein
MHEGERIWIHLDVLKNLRSKWVWWTKLTPKRATTAKDQRSKIVVALSENARFGKKLSNI